MFSPKERRDGYVIPAMDDEIKVKEIRKLLQPNTSEGGRRDFELLQVVEVNGGIRTIRTSSVIDVR